MKEYNGKISGVSINLYIPWELNGDVFVHRGHYYCARYSIKNLTQYQRAVRLLNLFVERNMR